MKRSHSDQGDRHESVFMRSQSLPQPPNSPALAGGLFSLLPPSATAGSPLMGPKKRPPISDKRPLVMKFGGSSLAGAEHLRRVSEIVRTALPQRPVLVLSAMGKTTNKLLEAADNALTSGKVDISEVVSLHETVLKDLGLSVPGSVAELFQELEKLMTGVSLLKEVSDRTRDLVVSFGERLSVRVFSAFFNTLKVGVEARALDSWEIGMLTTAGAGSAESSHSQVSVKPESYEMIAKYLAPLQSSYDWMPVVTGYIAKDPTGRITTLGRDGSDFSATIIGASTFASEVQIWKDVSGILTTDPRIVPAAKPVPLITYEEAAELTTFGSNVVHPAAVLPAWEAKVPIVVKNSLKPEDPGTRIVAELGDNNVRDGRVAAMSSKGGITMVVIRSTRMMQQAGWLAKVFEIFKDFEASVDVIATSEVTVSLTLDQGFKDIDVVGLRAALEEVAHVDITENMAMLTLITSKKDSSFVLRESFTIFEEQNVVTEMVSHGASNVNITFILPGDTVKHCIQKFHEVFFESPVDRRVKARVTENGGDQ